MLQFLWFSPPSSLCLGGHILKFPQDWFFKPSRFSSHLKDFVPRMVIRSSLFHLLSCSLLLPEACLRLGVNSFFTLSCLFFIFIFSDADLHPV